MRSSMFCSKLKLISALVKFVMTSLKVKVEYKLKLDNYIRILSMTTEVVYLICTV